VIASTSKLLEVTAKHFIIPKASSAAVTKSMLSNRARNTKPELSLRAALRRNGIVGYRLHPADIIGRPDICFKRIKLAIFVNGCFWHRCPRCGLKTPKTHRSFWNKKFEHNIARDKRKLAELKSYGWKPLVVWECQIKKSPEEVVRRIKKSIVSTNRT
jgi:DNA mismatch endonuclease (patch repair protein)